MHFTEALEPLIGTARTVDWLKSKVTRTKFKDALSAVSKVTFQTAIDLIDQSFKSNNPERELTLAISSLQQARNASSVKTVEGAKTRYVACFFVAAYYRMLGEKALTEQWVDNLIEAHADYLDALSKQRNKYDLIPMVGHIVTVGYFVGRWKDNERESIRFDDASRKICKSFDREVVSYSYTDSIRISERMYKRS